jgi:hypothetical protein
MEATLKVSIKKMKKIVAILSVFQMLSCINNSQNYSEIFLTEITPTDLPIEFMSHLIPSDKIVHKGIFSSDLNEYYYTLSDKGFKQFDVYVITKSKNKWSNPEKAFYNSNFSEHGMSFSPNGKSIYFSSTRPTNIDGIPATWHIWRSDKVKGGWSEPVFIDIPNLRHKLVSHPTITIFGTLYFHSSNLDYSEMEIYHSNHINGEYQPAIKTSISTTNDDSLRCTPYVSPNEDYLLFASIEDQLDLMISFRDGDGNWSGTRKLGNSINIDGQGNPYITPDDKFLFYTSGKANGEDWKVKWVNIENEIRKN